VGGINGWTIDVRVGESDDGNIVSETDILVGDSVGNVVSDDGGYLERGVEI